jgi:hypothetical protein
MLLTILGRIEEMQEINFGPPRDKDFIIVLDDRGRIETIRKHIAHRVRLQNDSDWYVVDLVGNTLGRVFKEDGL